MSSKNGNLDTWRHDRVVHGFSKEKLDNINYDLGLRHYEFGDRQKSIEGIINHFKNCGKYLIDYMRFTSGLNPLDQIFTWFVVSSEKLYIHLLTQGRRGMCAP